VLAQKSSTVFVGRNFSFTTPVILHGQATPTVPDWALPGSATHEQLPPPADFHRASRVLPAPIGIFDGQADVGGALVPGSTSGFIAKLLPRS
jgi:hypothetical protein